MSENSKDVASPKTVTSVSAFARLRTWFLTGIIVTAPIGITALLLIEVIDWFDSNVIGRLPLQWRPDQYLPFALPGLGLVLAVVSLTLIGFLTTNFLGRTIIRLGERIVDRMPIVRSIYSALKQIFETVLAQSSKSFREVVLVEWPRKGMWTIAFVTGDKFGEVGSHLGDSLVALYVPTTPNPTSGYLVYVKKSEVIPLAMSVDAAMRHVISGGMVPPPDLPSGSTPF